MVYTATSLSLAAIEFFVHIEPGTEPADLVSVCAWLPIEDSLLLRNGEQLKTHLPQDWRQLNHPVPRQIGADWITSGRTLAMMVPSVVIGGEWNVLINSVHAGATRIKLEEPKPFHFDTRMFKAGSP